MVKQPLNHPPLRGRKWGAHWEKTAESYLCASGLKLLNRNFSCRFGEIDLIMEDEKTIVFVEVKYRKSAQHGSGAEAITFHKQERLSRTAAWYLAKHPYRADQFCRFDVVAIEPETSGQNIHWIKSAFYSTLG